MTKELSAMFSNKFKFAVKTYTSEGKCFVVYLHNLLILFY